MKVSLNWIKEFVDIGEISPKEYAHLLTMSGSKVEGFVDFSIPLKNVVCGKILEVVKHETSDKLRVCKVDIGKKTIQIVTAEQFVDVGDLIPVALDNAIIAGNFEIKTTRLKDVLSEGMFLSIDELGINFSGEKAQRVLLLDPKTPIGAEIKTILDLKDDFVVEFEITSNRPDCLSVVGLARETAATLSKKLAQPKITVKEIDKDVKTIAKVTVENKTLCKRYMLKAVENVKITESPLWLKHKLEKSGIRAINNIVDITNYVMLEYGQPLHAFDIALVEGAEIIVRNAKKNEKIVTLDGQEKILDENMLMICDAKKPVAVAGIMGGEYSGINDDTKTILFESANFDAAAVRLTAQKLSLRTESSSRFEKGLDPNLCALAINRACELINSLNCGDVLKGCIDIDNNDKQPVKIPFDPEKINHFLGTAIEKETMIKILNDLEFGIGDTYVTPPTFRADIEMMADVAEEIARIYGYNHIPSNIIVGEATEGKYTYNQKCETIVKNVLKNDGLSEIITYSFGSKKVFDLLNIDENSPLRNTVVIKNPLGEENSVLRTTAIGDMMNTLKYNDNQRNAEAFLFEIANTYTVTKQGELPNERNKIIIGCYGELDFYGLKAMVLNVCSALNMKNIEFQENKTNNSFHPYKTADILTNGVVFGILGQIHPVVCDNFGIDREIYIAELDFVSMLNAEKTQTKYKHLPKYPAILRDIAIIVDESVLNIEIENIIKKNAKELLEDVSLFDIYKGGQIEKGKKSMAYSVVLRAADRTLKDTEAEETMKSILDDLKNSIGAILR